MCDVVTCFGMWVCVLCVMYGHVVGLRGSETGEAGVRRMRSEGQGQAERGERKPRHPVSPPRACSLPLLSSLPNPSDTNITIAITHTPRPPLFIPCVQRDRGVSVPSPGGGRRAGVWGAEPPLWGAGLRLGEAQVSRVVRRPPCSSCSEAAASSLQRCVCWVACLWLAWHSCTLALSVIPSLHCGGPLPAVAPLTLPSLTLLPSQPTAPLLPPLARHSACLPPD